MSCIECGQRWKHCGMRPNERGGRWLGWGQRWLHCGRQLTSFHPTRSKEVKDAATGHTQKRRVVTLVQTRALFFFGERYEVGRQLRWCPPLHPPLARSSLTSLPSASSSSLLSLSTHPFLLPSAFATSSGRMV
eukprot:TRINITY_DN1261_c0_g2_i1.p2 TRINITY_DN1261_c0_g2~~TRINITY_DN1261_c0_g2_i1.p2  ORF type:complete len:133 (-),score=11.57 TRINITY_DN1261_c0_g2_i1:13-411(-)